MTIFKLILAACMALTGGVLIESVKAGRPDAARQIVAGARSYWGDRRRVGQLSLLTASPRLAGLTAGARERRAEKCMTDQILGRLVATIRQRRSETADRSYTRQLLDGGPKRCARKLGEEAVETVIAAVSEDDAALTGEAADLIYHLLVLLESRDIALSDVLAVLAGRMGTSGLAEKASRTVPW
jgi:phosphoribosyl-ATP pyrophosphohydrolase